jgi:hypothetical protein
MGAQPTCTNAAHAQTQAARFERRYGTADSPAAVRA